VFVAVDFFAEAFDAVAFFVAVFAAAVFFAAAFVVLDCVAVVFVAVDFFAEAFDAVAFFVAVFAAAVFFAAAFVVLDCVAVVFVAVDFFAEAFDAVAFLAADVVFAAAVFDVAVFFVAASVVFLAVLADRRDGDFAFADVTFVDRVVFFSATEAAASDFLADGCAVVLTLCYSPRAMLLFNFNLAFTTRCKLKLYPVTHVNNDSNAFIPSMANLLYSRNHD
ncbi:MAG: hypothetical protein Q4P66_09400, partial [Actinomycetaceae bacterium]|nr:hypothetical protein [Actinomycetaceae bacterium]